MSRRVEGCRARRGVSFPSCDADDEEERDENTEVRGVATDGARARHGTATVSQATPAGEQALPRCKGFTTFYADFAGARVHRALPTTGYMNGNTECKLQYGGEYAGVFVLRGAISTCFTKIRVDALYHGETESVVRFVQGLNGIATDGVYGPDREM